MPLPDAIPLNPAIDRAQVTDGRARFREVLDAVNAFHGGRLPDYRLTPAILRDLGGEGGEAGAPVRLGPLEGVRVVAVPGFLTECVAFLSDVLTDALAHLRNLGADTLQAKLDGRGGAAHNALQLRDQIMALPEGELVILLAMSKGAVDTQEMLLLYPETRKRVRAVVSLVGAVCGSPLAHFAPDWLKWVERAVPMPTCKCHDGAAVESLMPETRAAFLKANPPVSGPRYYSLGAAVGSVAGMSKGMMAPYRALCSISALNDGQMLLADQILPGSEFLGVLDCDHIAAGMPFNRNAKPWAKWIAGRLLERNAFPREVMAEAVIRRVLEDVL